MHRPWSLLVLALAASACDRPISTAPASRPGPLTDAVMNDRANASIPPPDGGFIPFDQMEPGAAERARSLLAAAERMPVPASVRARRERERRDPVRHAVSEGPLPGGAIAAVVRAPGSVPARLIVISSAAADDRAMFFADAALDRDEVSEPEPTGRRIGFVHADGRVEWRGTGDTEFRVLGLGIASSPGRHFIATIARAAESGPILDVPGLGLIRIAEP
jgi:hypothetical protein